MSVSLNSSQPPVPPNGNSMGSFREKGRLVFKGGQVVFDKIGPNQQKAGIKIQTGIRAWLGIGRKVDLGNGKKILLNTNSLNKFLQRNPALQQGVSKVNSLSIKLLGTRAVSATLFPSFSGAKMEDFKSQVKSLKLTKCLDSLNTTEMEEFGELSCARATFLGNIGEIGVLETDFQKSSSLEFQALLKNMSEEKTEVPTLAEKYEKVMVAQGNLESLPALRASIGELRKVSVIAEEKKLELLKLVEQLENPQTCKTPEHVSRNEISGELTLLKAELEVEILEFRNQFVENSFSQGIIDIRMEPISQKPDDGAEDGVSTVVELPLKDGGTTRDRTDSGLGPDDDCMDALYEILRYPKPYKSEGRPRADSTDSGLGDGVHEIIEAGII